MELATLCGFLLLFNGLGVRAGLAYYCNVFDWRDPEVDERKNYDLSNRTQLWVFIYYF